MKQTSPNNLATSVRTHWLAMALLPTLGMAMCEQRSVSPGPADAAHTASPSPTAQTRVYQGTGVVKAINRAQVSIEIDHEEIKGLMPAMLMWFYVKDKGLLKGINPGQRIDFTLEDGRGGIKITEIRKR